MMKGKIKIREHEDILIPDAYIIDDLENIKEVFENNEFAHLPCTRLIIDEQPSENATTETVIVIEL